MDPVYVGPGQGFGQHGGPLIDEQSQKLLNEYAIASRTYADAVERMRTPGADREAFMRAMETVGTTHRASERARIKFEKSMARI